MNLEKNLYQIKEQLLPYANRIISSQCYFCYPEYIESASRDFYMHNSIITNFVDQRTQEIKKWIKEVMPFFADSTNKSILVAMLISNDQIATIKQVLRKFAAQLVKVDITNTWAGRLFETPCDKFTIINLFLTNNQETQIVYLGLNMTEQFSTAGRIINDIKNCPYPAELEINRKKEMEAKLDQFTDNSELQIYIWNRDKIIDNFEKRIIYLNGTDKIAFRKKLNDELDYWITSITSLANRIKEELADGLLGGWHLPITYLNLEWFYQQTDAFKCDPDSAEYKIILKKLAEKLQ